MLSCTLQTHVQTHVQYCHETGPIHEKHYKYVMRAKWEKAIACDMVKY